eukprot:TRINITY_DN7475_c0_g1_i2.p1 TRINITY_DN7475_c0_g1~~TRINITY_DN7475_c0_g1_i2.p1  ORF type:complete len:290 (+),score=34.93 TRINITY_DN7475_c0_g1_i2:50-919(+)
MLREDDIPLTVQNQEYRDSQLSHGENNSNTTSNWKLKFYVILVFSSIIVTYLFWNISSGDLEKYIEWASSIGIYGNLIIIILCILFAFPWVAGTQIISIGCGFLYDVGVGFVTVLVGISIGFAIAYPILRHFFYDYVMRIVNSERRIKSLMRVINLQPIKFGLMVRVLPLSIGIQTAILAVSKMSYFTFMWTSILSEIPQQLLFVYIGSQITDVSQMLTGNFATEQLAFLILQIVLAVSFSCFIVYIGKRELDNIDNNNGYPLSNVNSNSSSGIGDNSGGVPPELRDNQ